MPFTFTFTKYYLIRQKHYDKVVEYAYDSGYDAGLKGPHI